MRVCSVEGCGGESKAKSLCKKHYDRMMGTGTTDLRVRVKVTKPVCGVDGCARETEAKGMCNMHYLRVLATGSTESRKGDRKCGVVGCSGGFYYNGFCESHYRSLKTELERFWARVEKTDDCWNWTGPCNQKGYGVFHSKHAAVAHVFSYVETIGPIPDGLQMDHLCRNKRCVRPDHLEAVTAKVNTSRGFSPSGINSRKTHCIHGHPLSGDNLQISKDGFRKCVACIRRNSKNLWLRRSQGANS